MLNQNYITMKKLFILMALVGLSISAFAQQSVVEKNRLHGKVMQKTIITYLPKIEFGEEVSRDTLKVQHSFFNKNGQILYRLIKDGPKSEPNFSDIVFEYTDGRLSKHLERTPRVSDDLNVIYNIDHSCAYWYDSQGRLTQEDIYDKDSTLTRNKYTYTPNGYVLNQYNSKGKESASAKREGDTWVHKTSDGSTYQHTYDSSERLIHKVSTMRGYTWGLVVSTSYGYDKYGNIIYTATHEGSAIRMKAPNVVYKQLPDGRVKATLENDYSQERHSREIYYEYEYDSNGNWVKQENTYDNEILIAEIKYATNDDDFNQVEKMIAKYQAEVDSTLLKPRLEVRRSKEALEQARLARIQKEEARIDSLKRLRQEKLHIIELCRQADKYFQRNSELYEKNPLLCSTVNGYIEKSFGRWQQYSNANFESAYYIELDMVSKTRLQYIAATQLAAMKLMTEPELKQTLKEANKMLKKAADYDARVAWWDSYMKAVNIYWHRSETERTQKRELVGKCAQTFNKITDDVHRKFSWVISTYVEDYLGLDELRVGNTSQDRFFNGGGSGVNDFQTVDDYDIQWLQNLLAMIEHVAEVVSKESLEIKRLQYLFNPLNYSSAPHSLLSMPNDKEIMRIFDSFVRGELDLNLYVWSKTNPSDLSFLFESYK